MNSFALILFVLLATVGTTITSYVDVDAHKPFDCPPNEKYYKCSLEVCYKKCDHLFNPPPCPLIAANCYQPSCECDDGLLRDSTGTCVSEDECRRQHGPSHY